MTYLDGQPRHDGGLAGFLGRTVLWTAFFACLSTPLRRWFITMMVLTFAIIFTIQKPTEQYYADHWDGDNWSVGYRFPWYCIALMLTFLIWGVYGWVRAVRRTRWLRQTTGQDGSAITAGLTWWNNRQATQVVHQQAAAQATGQAVVDGLRQAYQETRQEPQETAGPAVHTDAAQQRPQSPTAASQRALPPAPEAKPRSTPASPPPPPGSGTPKLWVPTYSGRAKPVQRRETTLGGVSVIDHRSVDPDTL